MLTMGIHGSLRLLGAVLLVLAGCAQLVSADSDIEAPPEVLQNNGVQCAVCRMKPSSTLAEGLPKVSGQVLFRQSFPEGKLEVRLSISGFPADSDSQPRAVHIHQYGDLRRGCASTGGHYNPHGVHHPHHPGDFGNFHAHLGEIYATQQCDATLFGHFSIIGRAVVIHENKDDLGIGGNDGSLLHGNAGTRLGCCSIAVASCDLWNRGRRRATKINQ